ncbi:hypothetical protein [Pseudoalteromonas phage PH357]|nr:hypothetical protein [Pseudoalteromonas phage PH357]
MYEVVAEWKILWIIPIRCMVYSSWKLSNVEEMIEQLRKAEENV